MAQVLFVQVFEEQVEDECLCATAIYVNGVLVKTQAINVDDPDPSVFGAAEALEDALGVTLVQVNHVVGVEWAWEEITVDLINAGTLEAPATSDLMRGFYRCPSCFHAWEICDTLNEAMICDGCEQGLVEPYFSGAANATEADARFSLARQERLYPNPDAKGEYRVDVFRTAVRQETIVVEDACGPASAHFEALKEAGNVEFGSEGEAEYEVDSLSFVVPVAEEVQ